MLKTHLLQTSVEIKRICRMAELCLSMENCSLEFLVLRH